MFRNMILPYLISLVLIGLLAFVLVGCSTDPCKSTPFRGASAICDKECDPRKETCITP